jgi:hypothetical protein
MAAAAGDQKIYFFGGVGGNGSESIFDISNELWCFDTIALTWQQIPYREPWPSPRRCVGWTVHDEALVLWGGSGSRNTLENGMRYTFLNDLWCFVPSGNTWRLLRHTDDHLQTPFADFRQQRMPSPRYTPVFESVRQELFLFGGYTEDRLGKRMLNDAWQCSDSSMLSWAQIPWRGKPGYTEGAAWPGQRYGSMSTSDGRYVYVCGGFSNIGDHIDLWQFDPVSHGWTLLYPEARLADTPQPRYCAAFAFYERNLFLFGGRSRRHPKLNFNDLWCFDLDRKKWKQVQHSHGLQYYDARAEYPAYHAKSATAVVRQYWYIWGGEGLHGHVSDFWRFDFTKQEWELIQPARPDDPIFW